MATIAVAITICATASYAYALRAQARRIQGMILDTPRLSGREGAVILVGDDCAEVSAVERLYAGEILPEGWTIKRIEGRFRDGLKNYKHPAQLLIARMRSAAFDEARRMRAEFCLSLDSDVLPQPNSLETMIHSLEFDRGFYSVSTCPYPSQGGGDYLAGRGIPENPILPDVYPDERVLPDWLHARMEASEARLKQLNGHPDEAWNKERDAIAEAVKRMPAKGDVFFRNSTSGALPFGECVARRLAGRFGPRCGLGWYVPSPLGDNHWKDISSEVEAELKRWKPTGFRRRGWMSSAYPALGLGAMLPTDWCGFGCTIMGPKALALAQFDGYDGGGTEDLYVVYKRWSRHGLRINTLPHLPADHVIRDPDPKKKGQYVLLQAHHESRNAECIGHLRIERRPWFQQTDDEAMSDPKPKKTRTLRVVPSVKREGESLVAAGPHVPDGQIIEGAAGGA
jgi:hypothetical protein